jgi:RNA polymerase sigma-70 factor (ECF subfamily)
MPAAAAKTDAVESLAENHRRFLAFLERRVGSRETAEDLLQDAFVKGLAKVRDLRNGESATAWFYRLLRNALVDHYRRRGAEERALERMAAETRDGAASLDAELMEAACSCVGRLVGTLKPEYADALRRVDLAEGSVGDYARAASLTPGNAAVRLHRARKALKKQVEKVCGTCAEHGCQDCRCRAQSA